MTTTTMGDRWFEFLNAFTPLMYQCSSSRGAYLSIHLSSTACFYFGPSPSPRIVFWDLSWNMTSSKISRAFMNAWSMLKYL